MDNVKNIGQLSIGEKYRLLYIELGYILIYLSATASSSLPDPALEVPVFNPGTVSASNLVLDYSGSNCNFFNRPFYQQK